MPYKEDDSVIVEYLRRNRLVAKYYGAITALKNEIRDQTENKRYCKRTVKRLRDALERSEAIYADLRKYREQVGYGHERTTA